MNLSKKSLEKLRILINEETEYRSGPKLVEFFNELGFYDSYGKGFPSRWQYTDEKLKTINGSPILEKCIQNVLYPSNYIGRISDLDDIIAEFNKFLAFDKWIVTRKDAEIGFSPLEKIEFDDSDNHDNWFLKREFGNVSLENIGFEEQVTQVLKQRISEIEGCFLANAFLAVILLAGSTLEGLLYGLACKYPEQFNSSKSSPKDSSGKVRLFKN